MSILFPTIDGMVVLEITFYTTNQLLKHYKNMKMIMGPSLLKLNNKAHY